MEKDILGKWVQSKDEAYPGLYFIFKEDGVFEAYYDALGVIRSIWIRRRTPLV